MKLHKSLLRVSLHFSTWPIPPCYAFPSFLSPWLVKYCSYLMGSSMNYFTMWFPMSPWYDRSGSERQWVKIISPSAFNVHSRIRRVLFELSYTQSDIYIVIAIDPESQPRCSAGLLSVARVLGEISAGKPCPHDANRRLSVALIDNRKLKGRPLVSSMPRGLKR